MHSHRYIQYTSDSHLEQMSDHRQTRNLLTGASWPNDSKERTDQQEKVYVCLFTCTATLAVHLELTRDIGVEVFLLAVHQFASCRSLPATVISDNAKTFKSSSKQITKVVHALEV